MKGVYLELCKLEVHVSGEIDCHHCGKGIKTGLKLNLHKTKVHVNGEKDCRFG